MTPELRARLENVTNLPSPPAVATQVIGLARQPHVSLGQVAEAISCDASLSAKVLRVANSAMYAQRRKSTNLRQALVVLGLNATVTLALGFSLMPVLQRSREQNEMFVHTWRRSLLSAICARAIANVTRSVNAEEAFLSGLLQDIGIMALDRVYPNFYEPCLEVFHDHTALQAFERAQLNADHADVGVWLLRHWNLPEYLQDAVAVSHRFDRQRTSDNGQLLSRCVALSGRVADVWMNGEPKNTEVAEVARLADRSLAINAANFAKVMTAIGEAIPEMSHIFETELISAEEAQMITENACEVLTTRNLNTIQEAAALGETAKKLQSLAQDLEQETQRDALTEVASRGYLDELLQKGYGNARRFSWPLSIAFVDIDHFKKVNDTYGHQAGDKVLQRVSTALTEGVRCADTVGRYGGEEFLIILPGADAEGAEVVANRLLQALRQLTHNVGAATRIGVTASIGIASLDAKQPYPNLEAFIAAADQALYAAKRSGRNRFVAFGDHLEEVARAG